MRLDVVSREGPPTAEFYRRKLAAFHEEQRQRRAMKVEVRRDEDEQLFELVQRLQSVSPRIRATMIDVFKKMLEAYHDRGVEK